MSESVFVGLEPAEVWRHFAALTRIPRPPKAEEGARRYVQTVADAAGATWKQDARGNLIVSVAATNGAEGEAAVAAVQAHLDMVCVPGDGGPHDVRLHPVQPKRSGEWIDTGGLSTLGSDNGIGAAMALALLTTPNLKHGPLELLFTVEEEIGLFGALALESGFITARRLINLDSEDPRELVVGCAGGGNVSIGFPTALETTPMGLIALRVFVRGLKGGHSGLEIHLRRANAIRLLVRALSLLEEEEIRFGVAGIKGGIASNAIPTEAEAILVIEAKQVSECQAAVAVALERLKAEWGSDEPGLEIGEESVPVPDQVLTPSTLSRLLELLDTLPNGVQAMSKKFVGVVETSSNLALVHSVAEASLQITVSCRSLVDTEKERLQARIAEIAQIYGAQAEVNAGYPGWDPDPGSQLLEQTARSFEKVNGNPPAIVVIHAGAECGVILNKMPSGSEAISFGPRIEKPHTVLERVEIASVEPTWQVLTHLLESLA